MDILRTIEDIEKIGDFGYAAAFAEENGFTRRAIQNYERVGIGSSLEYAAKLAEKLGDVDAAKEAINLREKAILQYQKDGEHLFAAILLEKMGDMKRAADAYKKAGCFDTVRELEEKLDPSQWLFKAS